MFSDCLASFFFWLLGTIAWIALFFLTLPGLRLKHSKQWTFSDYPSHERSCGIRVRVVHSLPQHTGYQSPAVMPGSIPAFILLAFFCPRGRETYLILSISSRPFERHGDSLVHQPRADTCPYFKIWVPSFLCFGSPPSFHYDLPTKPSLLEEALPNSIVLLVQPPTESQESLYVQLPLRPEATWMLREDIGVGWEREGSCIPVPINPGPLEPLVWKQLLPCFKCWCVT